MPLVKSKGILNLRNQSIGDVESLGLVGDSAHDVRKDSLSSSPTSKSLDSDDGERHKCTVCSNVIGKKIDCIRCDNEKCLGWVHFHKCSKMTRPEYDFFLNTPRTRAKWFCISCEENRNANTEELKQQDKKIDHLTEVVNTMKQQLKDMFEMINNQNSQKNDSNTDDKVEVQISEVFSELDLKKEKKNNIIVYNLPEVDKKKSKQEQKDIDMKNVNDILKFVNPDVDTSELCDKNIERMGERKDHNDTKPRPIKIKFPNFDSKLQTMKNARKLAKYTKFKKIGLAYDKTKKEQLEDKILRDELEQKRRSYPDEGYVIFKGKVIKSSEKPAWARKNVGQAGNDSV